MDAERGGPAGAFTYGFDVHGSVSTLLDEQGDVHAAYGYSPYGAGREQLSAGDTDPHDPLNVHRYTAKRLDTGTGSLDMGARRFAPDAGRFLSRDRYLGALADLGLTFDPLTGNRYALAAGNPISFVEHDGRTVIPNGGGGSTRSASHAPSPDRLAASRGSISLTENYDQVLVDYFGQEAPSGAERDLLFLKPIENHGVIVARYFIASQRSAFLAGDDRGFDDDPTASYRVAMAWNTATGEVSTTVTKSCFVWQDSEQSRCATAFPINSFLSRNKIEVTQSADGGTEMEYQFLNSITHWGGGPVAGVAINGSIRLDPTDDGFNVRFQGDQYSSLEIYQYRLGQDARTLATLPERGLSAALPGIGNADVEWRNGVRQR